jgi:hypothetical protein
MPFHVEISSPLEQARVLDVEEGDLRTTVLEPWVRGLPFEFGERHWEPRECRLTILEGPALNPVDADLEESWTGALRAAEDVTRPLLEAAEKSAPARTAMVVEAGSVDAALRELRAGRVPQQIPWSSAAERIGAGDPEVAAVILVVKRAGPTWLTIPSPPTGRGR